jgi:hypothetical protein
MRPPCDDECRQYEQQRQPAARQKNIKQGESRRTDLKNNVIELHGVIVNRFA